MNVATRIDRNAEATGEVFDVLIVSGGSSGTDAAYHLRQHCPDKSFVLLETQDDFGGHADLSLASSREAFAHEGIDD